MFEILNADKKSVKKDLYFMCSRNTGTKQGYLGFQIYANIYIKIRLSGTVKGFEALLYSKSRK